MLTSTLHSPSDWLSLLFVNQYVCLNSPGAGLQTTPVSKNLSGLTIKAQVDSPGTALTVGGWPTTAEKALG